MGIMTKSCNNVRNVFLNASWIWIRAYDCDERDRRLYFRRTFKLDMIPEYVEIKITADSYYTLWVNGVYVNRGPARGEQEHWPFDRINLAPFLKAGKNVIAAMVYQYGMSNYSYSHEFSSGFLLSGKIESLNLGTSEEWKVREAFGYMRAVARASRQYCYQEFFDCRVEDGDWRMPDYDDVSWENGEQVQQRAVGCMPWHQLEERSIPLLTNDVKKPKKLVSISRHQPAYGWRKLQNIGEIYSKENPCWQSASGAGSTVIFEPGITAQLVDFGKEVVGLLQLSVKNAINGEMLDVMVCESISGVKPDFALQPMDPRIVFGGRLILKKGANQHEFTLPWGFRYLVLLRRDDSNIKIEATIRQTVYPLEVSGEFRHSDEKELNAIWRISEHTQRCCMVDAYIDCPWRENAQWWGDALVQAQNTFRLNNDTRLLERGIRQIARQTTPDGLTYGMAPTCGHSCILPDYSAIWIITLYAHYWQTGTPALWLELRETADDIFNYFESQLADDGLLYFDDRYWLFLDWCPALHKNGAPTTLNLIYLWALKSAKELAAVTGDNARVKRYVAKINQITSAITNKLYEPSTKILYDGLTFAGEPVKSSSPHSVALAIITDIIPEAHNEWLQQILLPLIRGNRSEELLPSPYFMYYIFEAVKRKHKYDQDIIECVRRWWGEFVDAGCSTTPENWMDKIERGVWSFCHAWSAHPLIQFSEIILGVRQTAPGWKRVCYKPLLSRGKKVDGTVPTPFGTINVKWDWTGNKPVSNIQLPQEIQLETKGVSTKED